MNRDRRPRKSHTSSRPSRNEGRGRESGDFSNYRKDRNPRDSVQFRNGHSSRSSIRASLVEEYEDDSYPKERGRKKNRKAEKQQKKVFQPTYVLPQEQIRANEEAIRSYKASNTRVCEKCNMPLNDIGSAVVSPTTGEPIHFDCAVAMLESQEKVEKDERIIYIGHGRFGILKFPNIHDARHFTIRKVIEWEDTKESKPAWRNELADLFSQVR